MSPMVSRSGEIRNAPMIVLHIGKIDAIEGSKSCTQMLIMNASPGSYAIQILLIASVTPTSFVSNSYSPIATTIVPARRPHQTNALVLGTRFLGK